MTGEICMYKGSLVIEFLNSFADLDVKVLAIVKNKENLIYSNTYDSSFYDREDDGFRLFRGPVYWIELFLSDGCIYDIFYGVVTSDRFLITSIVTPVLDDFCVYILKEINEKCGNVFDFSLYLNAPTHYTFHFRMSDRYYYATNNMGTEAVFISLDGTEIRYGDRGSVERYITEYEKRKTVEKALNRKMSVFGDVSLIDVVKKTNNTGLGFFADINQDLGASITMQHTPIVRMAYAYARRVAAGGLCLQGIFTYDQFLYVVQMFKMSQQITGHTVMFQEEACNQAVELLQSYDRRLDRLFANRLISLLYTQSENLVFPPFPVHYELVIQSVNAAFGE